MRFADLIGKAALITAAAVYIALIHLSLSPAAPSAALAAEPELPNPDLVLGFEPGTAVRLTVLELPEQIEAATARAVAPLEQKIDRLNGEVAALRSAVIRLLRRDGPDPPDPRRRTGN